MAFSFVLQLKTIFQLQNKWNSNFLKRSSNFQIFGIFICFVTKKNFSVTKQMKTFIFAKWLKSQKTSRVYPIKSLFLDRVFGAFAVGEILKSYFFETLVISSMDLLQNHKKWTFFRFLDFFICVLFFRQKRRKSSRYFLYFSYMLGKIWSFVWFFAKYFPEF